MTTRFNREVKMRSKATTHDRAPEYRRLHELHRQAPTGSRRRRKLGLRLARLRRVLTLDRGPRPQRGPSAVPDPEIVLRGHVGRRTRRELAAMLLGVADVAPGPVLHIRGSLVHGEDPALSRPVLASAQLELAARPVRAHVVAGSEREAIDLLESRLRRNLRRAADRSIGARRRGARPAGD